MTRTAIGAVVLSGVLSSHALIAQQATPDKIQQATDIAKAARAAGGSPTDAIRVFVSGMDKAFGPDAEIPLMKTAGLEVAMLTPMLLLRGELASRLRKMDPLDDIAIAQGIGISVAPLRLDAPDIIKVAVTRDGQIVAPIRSSLAPQPLRSAMGATVVKHSGVTEYPLSAFAPGAAVHITLIPETGANAEIDLSPARLALIASARDRLASTLVGLQSAEVERRIGPPDKREGLRWTYVTEVGSLAVYFDNGGAVTDAQPKTFDLVAIKR